MKASKLIMLIFTVLLAPFSSVVHGQQDMVRISATGEFAKLAGQISQINSTNGGYGNAFVIGPEGCHLLTNFHAAFGIAYSIETKELELADVAIGHAVKFSYDIDDQKRIFRKTQVARVVDFGNFEQGTSRGFLGDIALLKLDRCLGPKYGALKFSKENHTKRVADGKLMVISAVTKPDGGIEVASDPDCFAIQATPVTGMMLSTCNTPGGTSGSMILELAEDGQWRLAGLAAAQASTPNGRQISKSIYISAVRKFLAPLLYVPSD